MSGVQNKGKTYQIIPCEYCEREIATNAMSRHYASCKARFEYHAELNKRRLQDTPIQNMRLNEVYEAGREDEMMKYLESQKKTN